MTIKQQGIRESDYKVVPRTLIFLFNENDRVLLLRKSPQKRLWAGFLNGIGGHIEAGEDVMEAALRELGEEAGITDVALAFCGQIMIDVSKNIGVALFVFKGNYDGQDQFQVEDGELVWVGLNDLENQRVMEDLAILLPKVAVHKHGDALIIGKYTFDQEGKLKMLFL
jgi:8-oxo-dGTP diphosphatase